MDNLHQSQHLEYRLLKRGHLLYQHEVVKQGKTFELYIRDYLAETHNFNSKNQRELTEKTRIYSKVSDIYTLRPDLIQRYFNADCFDLKSHKQLVKEYNTSEIVVEQSATELIPTQNEEEQLAKVRAEIIKYESGEKQPKHIGQCMFGYLLKANYFIAYNDEQREQAWKDFTGLDNKPEMSYLRDPMYNKNSIDKETFVIQLKQIEEFFYLVGIVMETDKI